MLTTTETCRASQPRQGRHGHPMQTETVDDRWFIGLAELPKSLSGSPKSWEMKSSPDFLGARNFDAGYMQSLWNSLDMGMNRDRSALAQSGASHSPKCVRTNRKSLIT